MKKTTYAIIGLFAAGFLIIPSLMMVRMALCEPYDSKSDTIIEGIYEGFNEEDGDTTVVVVEEDE